MGKKKTELYEKAKTYYLENNESVTKIAKLFNIDRGMLSLYLKKQGIEVINKQNQTTIIENYFEIIDDEHKAYWLGFFFADGNVSSKTNNLEISLKLSDKEHLEKLAKDINFTNNISCDSVRCRLCFANKKMKEDLIDKGCVPAKSLILKPPKNIPDNLIIHFIRGYFDGDGCISFTQNKAHRPQFSLLGTEEFLNFIALNLIGTTKKLRMNHGSDKTWVLEYSGQTSRSILEKMYEGSTVYLERKYERYQKMKIALQDSNVLNALSKYGESPVKDNSVVNLEISKGSESPYSVEDE